MVGRRAGLRSLFLIAPIAAPASAQAVWVIPAAAAAAVAGAPIAPIAAPAASQAVWAIPVVAAAVAAVAGKKGL